MSDYDSRPDTLAHINQVRELLAEVQTNLSERSRVHDASKLEDPERAVFDEFTPKLRTSTYGSDEYKAFLVGMGEGLQHHYAHNSHHPEHYPGGFYEMTLLDVIEMLADWKAATMRHDDGDLAKSIVMNAERFGYDSAMTAMLLKTAKEVGWLPGPLPQVEWAGNVSVTR